VISKNDIKFIRSLSQKKYREQHKLYVVEGPKLVSEAIKSKVKIKTIYTTSSEDVDYDLEEVIEINEKQLGQISNLKSPNTCLAVVAYKESFFSTDMLSGKISLVLDGINDPGNLGTIIRTAEWFGVNTILCSDNCVDQYNPKVVQSTMGSIFRSNVHYMDLQNLLSETSIPSYGTFLNGENIYKTNLKSEALVVIGSESHGISDELSQLIQSKITIPAKGKAESLNAAVATGIVCGLFSQTY